MDLFEMITVIIVILGLAFTALAAVVRIVRGPTILDRMIASDVLLTTLMLAIVSNMALRVNTTGFAVMVAIAATAVLATIVVARYVRRKASLNDQVSPDRGTEHV